MAPKEAGRVKIGDATVKSRRVLGYEGRGVDTCNEITDAVECADSDGDVEKKGCQLPAKVGRCLYSCSAEAEPKGY